MDSGNVYILSLFEEFRDPFRIDGFVDEIQFERKLMAQFIHEGKEVEVLLEETHRFEHASQIGYVGSNKGFDFRVLDLGGDKFTGRETGPVNLGQGGRSHGVFGEFLEDGFERGSQLEFDLIADFCKIVRGHLILQARQSLDVLRRQDVRARTQELTSLEDDATQFGRGFVDLPS